MNVDLIVWLKELVTAARRTAKPGTHQCASQGDTVACVATMRTAEEAERLHRALSVEMSAHTAQSNERAKAEQRKANERVFGFRVENATCIAFVPTIGYSVRFKCGHIDIWTVADAADLSRTLLTPSGGFKTISCRECAKAKPRPGHLELFGVRVLDVDEKKTPFNLLDIVSLPAGIAIVVFKCGHEETWSFDEAKQRQAAGKNGTGAISCRQCTKVVAKMPCGCDANSSVCLAGSASECAKRQIASLSGKTRVGATGCDQAAEKPKPRPLMTVSYACPNCLTDAYPGPWLTKKGYRRFHCLACKWSDDLPSVIPVP